MSMQSFREAIVAIKDSLSMVMFSAMSNRGWFNAFNASPLSWAIKPMFALLLIILFFVQIYNLAQAPNLNIDSLLNLISIAFSAGLTNASIFGGLAAIIMGTTFAAGGWLFLSSVLVGFVHQFIQLILNLVRAYGAPLGSEQRMHYLQASMGNGFTLVQIAVAAIAVVFVIITPIAPIVASTFTALTLALIAANFLWRFSPEPLKQNIKRYFGFGKPEFLDFNEKSDIPVATLEPQRYSRLFITVEHKAKIVTLDVVSRRKYLQVAFKDKLDELSDRQKSPKIEAKIALLQLMEESIVHNIELPSKQTLIKKYPNVFQSFWCEKGEIEQLVDAVVYHQNLEEDTTINSLKVFF